MWIFKASNILWGENDLIWYKISSWCNRDDKRESQTAATVRDLNRERETKWEIIHSDTYYLMPYNAIKCYKIL